MAGLTAARDLVAAGWSVQVLEARDRVGGRIWTTDAWPGLPIDLGASWIHGVDDNPVTDLVTDLGARTLTTSYDSHALHIAETLRERGLRDSDQRRWESLVEEALDTAGQRTTDVSVAAALAAMPQWEQLSVLERADLAFFLSATYETEWGLEVARLSAHTVDDGEEFAGADALLPDGYAALPRHLARGLAVRLNTPVSAIRADDEGVQVTAAGADHRAEAAVVTVPLAVLASGAIRIEPAPSADARRALGRLGTGVLSKSFFRFDEPFWPVDLDWHEYLAPQAGHWSQWVSLARAGAPVLLGFNAGDAAREVEQSDPQAVIAEAHRVLRDMFGPSVPVPEAVLTTGWSRDPWALGSYSANTVGSTRQDRVALAEPVAGRIFWAGEATEPDHHSTVHGAVISGHAAARRLLDELG